MEAEERKKDRARLLLDRYGILFRALIQRELEGFRWADLFRSLRLMELSGEILAGYFFEDVSGPQFISHEAFQLLQHRLSEDAIYWFNATDPVSLCGVGLDPLKGMLPKRISKTHLVYKGNRLMLISRRSGKRLTIHATPEDPKLPEYLGVLKHLLFRKFQHMRRITIETINDAPAPKSEYVNILKTQFDVLLDAKAVTLYRKRNE